MGPPGAGKGSQSERLVKDFELTSISTGQMFRESHRNEEPLGIEAMRYIERGELVSDDITNEIVRKRLLKEDAERCFILDGYPRTVSQAKALDDMLAKMRSKLTAVINITVDKQAILERMVGRRVCKQCGLSYHLAFKPTRQDGICDVCGGTLYQRPDDQLESVRNRLEIYESKTQPLLAYYKGRGILREVDGMQSFDAVYQAICAVLKELT